VLQIFQFHIFPRFKQITIEREDKHGGNVLYHSYMDLQNDLESGNLHPQDAKKTLAHYLDTLIQPGRAALTD
jgi:tyrosyl-tRNA synthetase